MAATIFVRERRKIDKGEKKPRYRVVGVAGTDLQLYAMHVRKKELDQIATAAGATVVILDADQGKKDGGGQ